GSLNSGTAAPGTGTERTMRVVTHWPCSNCTRAQFLMSLSSVGASTRTISRQAPGGSVARGHCSSVSRGDGSGGARTKRALAGSGLRTRTWCAAAGEVLCAQMWYAISCFGGETAVTRTRIATTGTGGSGGFGEASTGGGAAGRGSCVGAGATKGGASG